MADFGVHVVIDAGKCKNKTNLISEKFIFDLLDGLPGKIGMTKMISPVVKPWLDKFSTSYQPGVSGIVMLAESHISIHTFPDYDYFFMDIFSCRDFDFSAIKEYISAQFEAEDMQITMLRRGINFPPKVYPDVQESASPISVDKYTF